MIRALTQGTAVEVVNTATACMMDYMIVIMQVYVTDSEVELSVSNIRRTAVSNSASKPII